MDKNRLDQLERDLEETDKRVWKLKNVVMILSIELLEKMSPEIREKLLKAVDGLHG